jgi:hypothetical protein
VVQNVRKHDLSLGVNSLGDLDILLNAQVQVPIRQAAELPKTTSSRVGAWRQFAVLKKFSPSPAPNSCPPLPEIKSPPVLVLHQIGAPLPAAKTGANVQPP